MRPDSEEPQISGEDEKDTGRLEAFSDGVFAVAITLLILDVKLPEIDPTKPLTDGQLLKAFNLPLFANFIAFVISFFTIGIMWLNHHRLFKQIKRTDTGLLLINLLLLMVIVFIPVPTAFLASYLFAPDQHLAALLYGGTFLVMAICFNVLWRYASHKGRLLGKGADLRAARQISEQYLFGPLLYLVALGLAFLNTPLSAAFQFMLALFFALPGRPRLPRRKGSDS